MPVTRLGIWWLALNPINDMAEMNPVTPRWWVIISLSILAGLLIVATFVIVKLWVWAYQPLPDAAAARTAETTATVASATNWDTNDLDLSSIPEGNEYLSDVNVGDSNATTTATTTAVGTKNDWATFVSQTLPVTFNYPSTWQLWEGTTPLSDYIQIADYKSKPQDVFAETVPGHKLEIALLSKPAEISLKKWIVENDLAYLDEPGTIEDLMVNGFPAKLDYSVLGYSTFGSVYIPLGDGTDHVLMMSLFGPETGFNELRPLLQSILDSMVISKRSS